MTDRRFRVLLGLCPPFVLVLWVAGVAHFRGVALTALEWVVLAAAAFTLQSLARRIARPRPVPPLPEGRSPAALAALAAAILAVPAAVLAGLIELFVESLQPSETSWGLRTLWHTACVFAVGYCTILLRLAAAPRPPQQQPPPPPAA